MFDLSFLIFISFVAAIIGLLVGIGLYRNVGATDDKVSKLNQALTEAEEKNHQYQQHVADHFSQTAVMLNDLTEKYKDIHHHLALGADQLCRDDDGHSLLIDSPLTTNASSLGSPMQPPLDYAPKTDAANVGTLAEDYGLEKVNLNEPAHADETSPNDPSAGHAASESTSEIDGADIKQAPPNVHAI